MVSVVVIVLVMGVVEMGGMDRRRRWDLCISRDGHVNAYSVDEED